MAQDENSLKLSPQMRQNIALYIAENYRDEYEECCLKAESLAPKTSRKFDLETMAAISAQQVLYRKATLADALKKEDAGFTETLLRLIDRSGRKDSEIYKKANISRQHFSKIRNNPHYKPTKATALALAIALELNLENAKDLIGRAGYALTNSSKFDLIVQFFIEQGNYDIVEINMALFEFDQPLLGA